MKAALAVAGGPLERPCDMEADTLGGSDRRGREEATGPFTGLQTPLLPVGYKHIIQPSRRSRGHVLLTLPFERNVRKYVNRF